MKTERQRRAGLLLWCAVCTGLAVVLWWWAYPKQLERACWIGEWPFEERCSAFALGTASDNPPELYSQHLQRNIGDSHAYIWLTQKLWDVDRLRAAALLPTTARLAPVDNRVLAMQAEAALQARDWPRAAQVLVQLAERGYGPARQPLTLMMLNPDTQDHVKAQLTAHARWLDPTLATMDAKIPVTPLLPFVTEGLKLGVVSPATVIAMMERLKSAGNWMDAYALWVTTLGQVKAGLYNAGFDQRASQQGFDWQWARPQGAKQGMRVTQVAAAPKAGSMLQVELTGRAALAQPLVRQDMVLPFDNRFRFSGRYMSDRFRTREGVVWALRCAQGGERWAQTAALKDTQRQWTSFELDVVVPASCAGAIRLQLETTQDWEARTGLTGVLYFDDFEWAAVDAEN